MANKLLRFEHTKLRMNERYSIDINIEEYDLMCKLAKFGLDIKKKSRNRYCRIIYFKNRYIIVGYNKRTCLIATVLYNSASYKRLIKNKLKN